MTKTALITGGAQRIGKVICEALHQSGFEIIIHYRNSGTEAKSLASQLNHTRANSASIIQADLNNMAEVTALANSIKGLSLLINNASSFYPTPIGSANEQQWDDLFNSNVKAAFFLSQALTPMLKKNTGSIINIIDIHSEKPMKDYSLYSMAKASLAMMTKSLAKDLGSSVRVNGVSPGAILWPEHETDNTGKQQEILQRIPLGKMGEAKDIAEAVLFLATQNYITGQIINIDGGRSLNM